MKKVSVLLPQSGWGTLKTKYPADSLFVRLDELTGGTKNVQSNVRGSLTKRPGGVNYNASTFATPAKDQFEAIFSDGVHHLLIVENGNLRFSSGGGTFTLVTAGYTAVGNFEFALYSDRVYFGNGIDSSQVYDRATTYGGVVYTAPQTKVMGAQAPSSAPTFAADTAGGSVPAGAHTYKVTFLYYDFEESNGGPASAVRTVVNPNNTVNLTALPIGGYGVTARKIYRDDNDGNWLLVGTVANNTATTFSDTASTGTAPIPLTNDVPPSFKYITTHLDRIWIAGIPGDPSSLRFSEAGLPDIFPSANDILCNPEDPITALVVYNNQVWVFNRNSIGRINGRTRDTFSYAQLPGAVGCVDNRSIRIRTVDGVPTLIWLSDKGIYGTNGSSVEYLSDPIEDLVNLNIQQAAQVRGQNAQTSQTHFQAGTASPGIDLTSSPGTITTPNPRRLWDDETDWEGGSSLTNVATNDNSNQISVVTRHAPAYADGTHSGTIPSGSDLTLTQAADQVGGTNTLSGSTFTMTVNGAVPKRVAQRVVFDRPGTVTSITFYPGADGGNGTAQFEVWTDSSGSPGSPLGSANVGPIGSSPATLSTPTAIFIATPGAYWIVIDFVDLNNGITAYRTDNAAGQPQGGSGTTKAFDGSVWGTPVRAGTGTVFSPVFFGYTFSQNAVASAGLWTGPTYDSKSDSALSATITHTGTFPGGTSSTTTVEASNDPDMLTGVISVGVADNNGTAAAVLADKRYWRIKIMLTTTDDRFVPTTGPATLAFNTTATWISEAIDHTTDITALNSLTMVSNTPVGTTATLEIATSADNIIYSAFTALGSAVVQRYSKVRITLTSTGDNVTTPTVTSARLNWTLVSNLISSAIDTGATPAGWDIFQAQFATNGGTVAFHIRTAATAGTLGAATFVAVTNGAFPTNTVFQFAQWRVTITSTSDTVPTVDSVTINWFISQTTSIRVASIFYNKSYYLAAAEYNQTTNNILIEYDLEGKWRTHRGITIATLSYFFNEPYYGSSVEGRIIKFLTSDTDQGVAIELVIETKAMDFGDMEHTKIGRKVYLKGKNTGAVYQVFMSFDDGTTYQTMYDVATGSATFTTSSDGTMFRRRFQVNFDLGQAISGKTVRVKIVESTTAAAQIDQLKVESWIRAGELVA